MGNRGPWKTLGGSNTSKTVCLSISVGFGGPEMEAEVQLLQNQREEWRWLEPGKYV